MAGTIQIVPNLTYISDNGRQCSIHGAAPWTSEAERQHWHLVTRGYTWRVVDHRGSETFGLCRVPAKTYAEAEAVAFKAADALNLHFIEPETVG